MDKINLDQLQKIDIEGETIGVGEALQVLGNFANTASLEIGKINTEIEGMETDVSEKVSTDRLDEFIDDGGTTISLETWASNVETFAGQVTQGMDEMGNTIQSLPQTYATKAQLADYVANQRLDEFNPDDSATDGLIERWAGGVNWQIDNLEGQVGRLNNFTPSSSAAAGSIEKWASTVGGGGLPPVTSADAYSYLKVDSNGNIIAQAPIDGLGDGDFSGDLSDIPNAGAIQDLIYMIDGWTQDSINQRIDEIEEANDNFKNYEIIRGNTMTGQADAQGYTLYPVTFVADTDLIGSTDVIFVDIPTYGFSEYLKVKPYGESLTWYGIINLEVEAKDQDKTTVDVTVYKTNGMLDYPFDVTITGYQVKEKPIQKSDFESIMGAYFYED